MIPIKETKQTNKKKILMIRRGLIHWSVLYWSLGTRSQIVPLVLYSWLERTLWIQAVTLSYPGWTTYQRLSDLALWLRASPFCVFGEHLITCRGTQTYSLSPLHLCSLFPHDPKCCRSAAPATAAASRYLSLSASLTVLCHICLQSEFLTITVKYVIVHAHIRSSH